MKSDEAIIFFLLIFIGIPIGFWFIQDEIYMVFQFLDLLLLKALSFIPYFGARYSQVEHAYSALEPSQLTFQHIWIAGQIAWRPVGMLVIGPLMLRWAWQAYKKRRAQGFEQVTKSHIDKHCRSRQVGEKGGARQQWTVRHWFHHYGLHLMAWGSMQWNMRIRKALSAQLGWQSSDERSRVLVEEFAEFIHSEVVLSFGAKTASIMPPKMMVEESLSQHAYVSTAMVRILAAARDQFGVVSPQGFRNRLFQDPETVPIWFALNGLMRQTNHIESQGALSHFYDEICEEKPVEEPQLHNALEGLEQYRSHLINQRKLSDLDESEKEALKLQREEVKRLGESPLSQTGYSESDRLLQT